MPVRGIDRPDAGAIVAPLHGAAALHGATATYRQPRLENSLTSCVTPAELERLDRGVLDENGARRVREHIDSCEPCRQAYQRFHDQTSPTVDGRSWRTDATVVREPTSAKSVAEASARHYPTIEGYKILGVLGQGGMGIVYRAVQAKLSRMVALKVLPAIVGTASPNAVARFRREAMAAARLHHTNIVPIYDFGESRDAYYYAMELISGRTLDVLVRRFADHHAASVSVTRLGELLRTTVSEAPDDPLAGPSRRALGEDALTSTVTALVSRGRPYYQEVARWMADAADGLHYAHSQGIIHRDVKPANLILSADGRIMIADFGLAKTAGEESVTLTGALVGSLRYISPEQAMAKRVRLDHRTDVYSLGATMYELLSFQPAFPGTDEKEILGAIISRDPPSPRKIAATVPVELDTICMKTLEKSADARYATAQALAQDLRRFIADLPIAAKRPSPIRRVLKFVKRHKAPTIAVTSAVLLIASTVFLAYEKTARKRFEISSLYESAMSYTLVNKWSEAERDLDEALGMDPQDVKTLLTLAWLHLERFKAKPEVAGTKALEEAESVCRRILRLEPDNVKALGYRGVALRRLSRNPEAIQALERAVELEPGAYASWTNLGALYAVVGDLERAEARLRKATQIGGMAQDRWHATAWRNLAALELHLRDGAAFTDLDKALQCNPLDIPGWVLRTRMWLELPDRADFEQALDDAKHADKLALEKDAKAKRVRALAHLRNDQWDHAIAHARSALELGDLPTINHLIVAVAEAKQGKLAAAREQLSQAESFWPDALREPGSFHAVADTGDLWIDSADQLIALHEESRRLAAAAPE